MKRLFHHFIALVMALLILAAQPLAAAARALAGRENDRGERRAMALDIAALLEEMDGTI